MNVKHERICRLCLREADSDFQIIDEITRKMFEVLLLKVNLDIIMNPIICKGCTEVVERCLNFKSACNDTEKLLFSFTVDKKRGTFKLNYVYTDGKDIETIDDNVMCRFCWKHLSGSNLVLLETLTTNAKFAEMLQVLMPEMDFDFIKNPVVCRSCRQNLECYFKFVENCLDVEEKITKYFCNEDSAFSVQANLSDIRRFSNNISKLDYVQIQAIKREEDILEDIVEAHSEVNNKLIKDEEIDIKPEDININETNQMLSTKNILETKYKTSPKKHELTYDNIREVKIHKCSVCTYETKKKSHLITHTIIHKDITEVEMYYKCPICAFSTKYKNCVKKHMLIHKDITEVEMYKCSICAFSTKYKNCLKKHMLIHKDITEVEMYKCSICAFSTKYKTCLKNHMLIHKDITEVDIYKCSICVFSTIHKYCLKKHMLTHKDITEVNMYECSMCTFKTKHKSALKSHTMLHDKDAGQVTLYKCSVCTLETKERGNLKRHMLTHKDITEVEMYKCAMCTFVTKLKGSLKRHICRRHNNKSLH